MSEQPRIAYLITDWPHWWVWQEQTTIYLQNHTRWVSEPIDVQANDYDMQGARIAVFDTGFIALVKNGPWDCESEGEAEVLK